MEEDSHPSQTEHPETTEPQNHSNFSKSLQELKDLCSQLHAAAGYCESTFMNSNHKHLVVENTKEYVCRAVVAVVDHLGSASENLEQYISEAETNTISQTEVKIGLVRQKLFICQEYSDKLALAKLTWRAEIRRYNSRYLKPPVSDVVSDILIQNPGSEIVTNTSHDKNGFKIDEEIPLFFYTCIYDSSPSQSAKSTYENDDKANVSLSLSALPVRDNLSCQPKHQALSFQLQEKRVRRRGTLFRKSMTSSDILSIVRRRK
ncbi:hypothetical protein SSX86_008394 [Deinandra increscens subsp. villosa]|uniref:ABI family n=1 Tax=Deinandra increscens subsp. villosa TaxID=3103831 RepID=A0AAP0DJ14_9ASTR